jgi:hypothetical protein
MLLLARISVEFLFGSTRLSTAYLLLPQIGVYGAGAPVRSQYNEGHPVTWAGLRYTASILHRTFYQGLAQDHRPFKTGIGQHLSHHSTN